ncbi:MAG: PAS domain S-box protein [Geothrix sp.]|nr:PAS domain S-box protein [Geothrix sp.]
MSKLASLRVRLFAIALLAIGPGLGLAYYTAVEGRRRATAEAHEAARDLAGLIALQEGQLLDGTRQLLVALSHQVVLPLKDPSTCRSQLQHILGHFGRYANLGIADLKGDVICSALPMPRQVNVADRSYFRLALQARDFSIGDYQVGRTSSRPSINFGYPVLDDQGGVHGVVFAALDLERLQEFEKVVASKLPAGATLTKMDADGTVLVRQPDPGGTVGHAAFSAPILRRVLAAPSGSFLGSPPGGEKHLYAFSQISTMMTGTNIRVVLAVPEAVAFSVIQRALLRDLLALVLVAGLAMALTWVISERLVVGPVRRLVGATSLLAGGEFSARSRIPHGQGEIGELARAFDEMAASLERREAERGRAEATLRESEERYRGLFENAYDIIYTHDLARRVTSLNKAGEAIIGYSRDEVLGRDIVQLVAPEHRSLAGQTIERMLAGEDAAATYELEIVTREGRRVPIEVSSRLIYADGRPIAVQGIARDVSERKRLQSQLAQAQKMEAVGLLASGIAHDFNNLLGVIIGFCELMEDNPSPRSAPQRLSQIKDAGMRAAALTRQLLAFGRKQVLEPRVLDLNAIVTDTVKLIERLIGEDIALRIRLASDLGSVSADLGQMEQVIMNLAVNARDAMVNGGSLSFETANADLDEAYAGTHAGVMPGRYVMLAVSDTGLGMDVETQARIFEPFFTTKEKGKGTGLGLATVFGVVKQSGGNIWVYSELGQGTTFKVYLPRVDEPAEAVEVQNAGAAVPGGTETILLVEDDASLRELAREHLERNGYTVLAAPSPFAALELARLHAGRIQLLFTDVVLPGMNGRALADQLVRMLPEVRVLYASGYPNDAIACHGVLEAGIHFLSKPYMHEALARKVREALDEGRAK